MLMRNETRSRGKHRSKKDLLMPKYGSYSQIKKPITAKKSSWVSGKNQDKDLSTDISQKINSLFRSLGKSGYKNKKLNLSSKDKHSNKSKSKSKLHQKKAKYSSHGLLRSKNFTEESKKFVKCISASKSKILKKRSSSSQSQRDNSLKLKKKGLINSSKAKVNGYSLLYGKSDSESYLKRNGVKKRAGTAPKTTGVRGKNSGGKYGNMDRLGRLLHSGNSVSDNRMFNFFRSKENRSKRSNSKNKRKNEEVMTLKSDMKKLKGKKQHTGSFGMGKNGQKGKHFMTHSPKKTSGSRERKKKLKMKLGYETSKSNGFSARFYTSQLLKNSRKSRNLKTSASRKHSTRSKNLSKSRKRNEKSSKSKKKVTSLGSLVTQVSSLNTKTTTGSFFSNPSGKTFKRKKSQTRVKSSHKQLRSKNMKLSSLRYKNTFYMQKLEIAFKSYSNDPTSVLYRKHFKQCIQTLGLLRKISKNKNPIPDDKLVELPSLKDPKKKTVIFDLDETLIHCNEDQTSTFDVKVPVHFPTGEFIEAGINIRPYAKEILKELSEYFEVLIFTASHSCYANPVIDFLDPENKYVKKRLFRDNCIQVTEGLYVKDLDILYNRDMKDVILIDNAAYSYSMQLKNGIPIVPFYCDKNDEELIELQEFLIGLKDVPDVRPVISRTFKGTLISKYANNMNSLFKKIFGA